MLKSFRAFLESEAGQQAFDSDFISRFLAANVRVETRSQLGQFAKRRDLLFALIHDLLLNAILDANAAGPPLPAALVHRG
jgi:hypothetical protein